MKIGIMTLQLHRNYGGVLQNFALQSVLRSLGHAPITIDKRPSRNNLRYTISYIKYLIFNFLNLKSKGIFYCEHTTRGRGFDGFVKKHISTTISTSTYSEKLLYKYHCDLLIVGSDQVWRRAFFSKEEIKTYFCSYIKNQSFPLISYAASFGVDNMEYEEDLAKECKALISKFIGVSVREDSGISLFSKMGFHNAVGVLDPTLLLTAKDYTETCSGILPKNEKFLLAYLLDDSKENIDFVNKLAREYGLKPVIVVSEYNAVISVEEWIANFRDCEYVVTDSFHGTVFSIIFKKSFRTIINKFRGADRFFSLLNRLELSDRIVDIKNPQDVGFVNWNIPDKNLDHWRKVSMDFLIKSLSEAQQKIL